MKKCKARRLVAAGAAAAALICALPVCAATGWQVDAVDSDFPDDPVRYYLRGKDVRIENLVFDLAYLIDMDAGTVYIVDARSASYAGGHVSEVKSELAREVGNRSGRRKPGRSEGAVTTALFEVRIEELPGKKEIAGFPGEGFRIFLDDLLVEEVWLAPEIDAARWGKGGELFHLMEAVTGGTGGANDLFPPDYEKDGAYRDIMKRGFPVRRITYFLDIEHLTEVVRAERRDLPDELFSVPADYRRVGYSDLFPGGE